MPVFNCRGEDGINREIEVELGECDICHKAVLAERQSLLPPPFTERQWPQVRAEMERLFGSAPPQPQPIDEAWSR